jgi:molybdopterin-guanine dinucleotide biosynthesis protein A
MASADGVDAVVPRSDRGYHPLCAVYTRTCRESVIGRLDERRLAITGERFGPGRRLLVNVNTPAEFDELEALPGHKP